MWGSLTRAGTHFSNEVTLTEKDQTVQVVLFLHEPIPRKAIHALKKYIKEYSYLTGWKVKKLKVRSHDVEILASKAESSLSKNLEQSASGSSKSANP